MKERKPLRTRMTRVDWDIINAALALYECDDQQEIGRHSDRHVKATRQKVWERMIRAGHRWE